MRTSKRRRGDDSSSGETFEHASQHRDLESLLAEHLKGTGAAESIVENLRGQRFVDASEVIARETWIPTAPPFDRSPAPLVLVEAVNDDLLP